MTVGNGYQSHCRSRIKIRNCSMMCILLFLFTGCASVNSAKKPAPVLPNAPVIQTAVVPRSSENSSEKKAVRPSAVGGIIFGKADFRGVLKVEYVKLNIVDESDSKKQYELLFGERDENNSPTWDARPVEPHYFFLELPVGKYKITAISIPVGTTLATENTDIHFTVEKETVIYLGTLMVTGTDQKIRFGGVPFLRPGFEYKVEILDEKDEAIGKFKARYPSFQRDIQVKLMEALRIHAF